MLLVIDVGNTNMVIGVYGDKHLIQNWRLRTERRTTEDEFNILAKNLFSEGHINSRNIHKTIIFLCRSTHGYHSRFFLSRNI